MNGSPERTQATDSMRTIFPCYRYVDVEAAAAFLVRAFAFELHATARDDGGGIRIARNVVCKSAGFREYSAWDPEGHLWHFGDYDPFNGVNGTSEPVPVGRDYGSETRPVLR